VRIELLPRAERDRFKIADYYLIHAGRRVAEQFFDGCLECFHQIRQVPFSGQMTAMGIRKLRGTRSMQVPRFERVRVYYEVQDNRILVVRILDSARDLRNI
jgi:plasmid stabilization system protein ParE